MCEGFMWIQTWRHGVRIGSIFYLNTGRDRETSLIYSKNFGHVILILTVKIIKFDHILRRNIVRKITLYYSLLF